MLLESIPFTDEPEPQGLLDVARQMLQPPVHRERAWPAVAAAAFFAVTALGFAVASIMAPPVLLSPAAKTGVR